MKSSLLSLFILLTSGSVFAVDHPAWQARCFTLQTGHNPAFPVSVNYGESKDVIEDDKYIYKIQYGYYVNAPETFVLLSYNKETKLQSYASVDSDSFPKSMTLVSAPNDKIFFCETVAK